MTDPWWKEVAAAVDPLEVLEALAIDPKKGRGESGRWALPHHMCDGQHGDGEPAIFYGATRGVMVCRACGGTFGTLATLAMGIGRDLPPAPWAPEDADVEAIRAEAEARGWCTLRGPTPAPSPRPVKRPPRRTVANKAWLTPAQLAHEWAALRAHSECWRQALGAWCAGRGWPADLIDAIVGVGETPVEGVAVAGPPAPALHRLAARLHRPLLFAVTGADERIRSVSRRWLGAGAPRDGMAKAMALSAKTVGRSAEWGCRAFGSVPAAARAVAYGGRILLVEGAPDFMVAQGLVRLGYGGAAVGADSASAIKAIAERIAEQVGRPEDVEVWTVPDVKLDERGRRVGAGLDSMRAAARIMTAAGLHVRQVDLPVPDGRTESDLSDVAAMAPSGVALGEAMRSWSREIKGRRPRRTGRPKPTMIGARVKDEAGRICLVVGEPGQDGRALAQGLDHRERRVRVGGQHEAA